MSGPVRTEGGAEAFEPLPREFPALPRPGASPADIVSGFLRASVVASTDFTEARAYLAGPEVAWDPQTGVVLHEEATISVLSGPGAEQARTTRRTTARTTAAEPTTTGPTSGPATSGSTPSGPTASPPPPENATASVVVTARAVATLDPQGRLTLLGRAEPRTRTFRLTVRRGQWRISALDEGVLMSLPQFVTSTYRSMSLYYPDATGDWLVPDVRYIRQGLDSTQTQVVSALLDGPAAWLATGLEPASVRPQLTVSSVPVAAGVATVDLTEAATALDQRRLAILLRQLEESLRAVQLPIITRVELTVGGQRLAAAATATADRPGVPGQQAPYPASSALAGGTLVGADAKARLVTVASGQPRVVDKLALAGGARPAMTYGTAQPTFALIVAGRAGRSLRIARPGGPVLEVVAGADLTTPSFDAGGWVWTCPRRPRGLVVAGQPAGGGVRRVDVRAGWLAGGEVAALRVSREGARALLVLDTVAADGRRTSTVALCGVRRLATGQPVALGEPVRLLPDLVRASDAAWLDDTRVVVLGTRRSGGVDHPVQPWIVDVGGDPSSLGVSATSPLGAVVADAAGRPVTRPAQWERLGLDVAPTLAVGDGPDAIYVATDRADLFHYRQSGSWELVRSGLARPAFPG